MPVAHSHSVSDPHTGHTHTHCAIVAILVTASRGSQLTDHRSRDKGKIKESRRVAALAPSVASGLFSRRCRSPAAVHFSADLASMWITVAFVLSARACGPRKLAALPSLIPPASPQGSTVQGGGSPIARSHGVTSIPWSIHCSCERTWRESEHMARVSTWRESEHRVYAHDGRRGARASRGGPRLAHSGSHRSCRSPRR